MLKETSLLNIIHCNSHTRQFCLNESEVTVLVAQSCLTVCDSMDYGLPDSFVHGDSPLSMGFSRQEDCSGLPFPSPGDLPDAGIEPRSHALQVDSLSTELRGKPPLRRPGAKCRGGGDIHSGTYHREGFPWESGLQTLSLKVIWQESHFEEFSLWRSLKLRTRHMDKVVTMAMWARMKNSERPQCATAGACLTGSRQTNVVRC